MRTFTSVIKTELIVLGSVLFILVASTAVFLPLERTTRLSLEDLRDALAVVNGMVVIVQSSSPVMGDADSAALEDAADELSSIAAVHGDRMNCEPMVASPVEFFNEHGADAALGELRATARGLSDSYYSGQERRIAMLHVTMGGLVAMVAVLFLLAIRSRRRYAGFVDHTRSILERVAAVLEHHTDEIDLEACWEEERLLVDAASRVAASARADAEMSGDWVYGNLEAFMPHLKRLIEQTMPCDRVAVAFTGDDGDVVAESAATSLPRIHLEPGFRERLTESGLGSLAASPRTRIIGDLEHHYREVHQSRGTELILQEGIRSSVTVPITIRDRTIGFLFVSSRRAHAYDHADAARLTKLVMLLKQNIYFHFMTQQTVAAASNAFVNLMERKDNETSLHIARMAQYSHIIARALINRTSEVNATLAREILWFAPLHDIGKIGIPDAVLLKPGPLTPEERRVIETHVSIGAEVVERMNTELGRAMGLSPMKTALDIIYGHHERYDGTGYPSGLAGDRIPVAGRITAVADVFDALTSRRPYKAALPLDQALEIMTAGSGSHFDPLVFNAFVDSLDEVRLVYERYKEV